LIPIHSLRYFGGRRENEDETMAPRTPYDIDLDRNPANFQPLTPLTFLERAASVFPAHTAIIHGKRQINYRDFYARSRRLASALAKRASDAATPWPWCWPIPPRCSKPTMACR
jgi:hypothetical protein